MTRFILFFILNIFSLQAKKIPAKVALCGICKNVEKALPYSTKSLELLGEYFQDYHIFVYENNSKDKTPKILKKWAQDNPKIYLKSEKINKYTLFRECINVNVQNHKSSREEQIARARNIILSEVMKPQYDDYSYVIWLDMDFEHFLPFEAIVEAISSKRSWDALFANGTGPCGSYYDAYALRDTIEPLGPEMRKDWWGNRSGIGKIKDTDDWIRVYSAFGGLGIYKRETLRGCRYSGIVTPDLDFLMKKIIDSHLDHPRVLEYYTSLESLDNIQILNTPQPGLPYFIQRNWGFKISADSEIIWRMGDITLQYPVVCEHVPLHATMTKNGHDKFYIVPKIRLTLPQ